MASIKVSLLADDRSLVRGFKNSTKAAEKFNQSMGATSKATSKTGRSFAQVGRFASRSLLGGAGIAAAIGSTLNKAGDFERSLNVLQATSGATAGQMVKVSATAKRLGGDITLPATSAKDAADAMLELSKGGLSVTSSMAAAKGTLQLAAAGNLEGAQAAQIQANALSQFNLAGAKAGLVADVLANTANAATGEVTDMATALTYVGPVAAGLGVSITETGTAIGLLAKNGILGDKAGTALRSMMVRLAGPTPKAAKGLKTLGIEAFDSRGKFKGLRTVIAGLAAAHGRLSQQQFTSAAAAAFGREPLAAMVALAREGGPAFDKMGAKVGKQGGAAALAASHNKGFKGALDGLKSAVETLQIAIGLQLLPTVTKNVKALSAWLSSTRNQATIMKTLRDVASAVSTVLKGLHTGFRGLNAVTGGTKRTVELLIGAYVAFKALSMASAVSRIASSFGLLRTKTVAATAATRLNTAATKTNALSGFGTTAGGAAKFGKAPIAPLVPVVASAPALAKLAKLKLAIGRLAGAPYLITFALVAIGAKRVADQIKALQGKKLAAKDAAIKPGEGAETTLVPALAKRITAMKKAGQTAKQILPKLMKELGGSLKASDLVAQAFAFESGSDPASKKRIEANVKKRAKSAVKTVKDTTQKVVAAEATKDAVPKVNFENRNKFFDALISRRLDRVQDISGTSGQLAALKKIAGQIKARIAATKDITRKLALEDQLLSITRQEKGLREQAKTDALQKKKDARDKRIKDAETRRTQRTARQFFALGLDATGGERVPFKKTLQRQLGTVSDAVKGTFLDTPKTRSLLARIRKVLKEGIVPTDVRAKVKEMLAGVSDELKNGTAGHTKFKKANTDAVLAGLGLSPKQIQALRGRLSQVGVGGTVHGTGVGAFGVALPATAGTSVVHTTINVDGQKMAVNTTKHQNRRRATSRRG